MPVFVVIQCRLEQMSRSSHIPRPVSPPYEIKDLRENFDVKMNERTDEWLDGVTNYIPPDILVGVEICKIWSKKCQYRRVWSIR